MKKTITLLLVLCMIFGMMPMTVFGEAEPVLNMVGYNITLRDSIYLKYAVQAENAGSVKMLLWNGPRDSYELGTQDKVLESTGTESVAGVNCLVFVENGLAMKQMTDVIYARPVTTVNGTNYYGEVVKYSILQYAYNKLGKTGTASTNAAFRDLLESMLVFGANAQRYLNYRTDSLADSAFYEVAVKGGVLDDGFAAGLYQTGSTVQLTAPEMNAEGVAFNHWETSSGANAGSNAVQNITVGTSNETYVAVYGQSEPEGPVFSEGLEIEIDGDEAVVVGMGTCKDEFVRIPPEVDGVSVVAIDSSAFEGNKTMTSVFIPSSVIDIGAKAFNNCSNLTDVYYEGTEDEFDEISIGRNNNPLNNAEIHFESYGPTVDPKPEFDEPTVYVSSGSAKPGETVDVTVELIKNPGVAAIAMTVEYDNSVLRMDSLTYGPRFADSTEPESLNSPVGLLWDSMSNLTDDVVFATLHFTVLPNAASGARAEVKAVFNDGDINDLNEQNVNFNAVNGVVAVQ